MELITANNSEMHGSILTTPFVGLHSPEEMTTFQ